MSDEQVAMICGAILAAQCVEGNTYAETLDVFYKIAKWSHKVLQNKKLESEERDDTTGRLPDRIKEVR